jgi:hypothetical protein
MSKLAEKKAEKRFPLRKIDNGSTEVYYNAGQLNHRKVYIEAYDQAMQDLIEKAEKWLEKHMPFGEVSHESVYDCIQEFKNYMQK